MTILDEINGPDKGQDQNFVELLVGEGKKFASLEDAVNALGKKASHADSFIETLKAEKASEEAKAAELAARVKSTEEILEAINGASTAHDDGSQTGVENTSLTKEDIAKLVEERFEAKNSEAEKEALKKKSWEILAEGLGGSEQAKTLVREYIGEDGGREELVNTMWLVDPESLVKLLSPGKVTPTAIGEGSHRTSGSKTEAANIKITWADAKKLKRENPVKYYSTDYQRMIREAVTADPDFYNK